MTLFTVFSLKSLGLNILRGLTDTPKYFAAIYKNRQLMQTYLKLFRSRGLLLKERIGSQREYSASIFRSELFLLEVCIYFS